MLEPTVRAEFAMNKPTNHLCCQRRVQAITSLTHLSRGGYEQKPNRLAIVRRRVGNNITDPPLTRWV